jgi:ATP-dependent protease ClpP protease subunit
VVNREQVLEDANRDLWLDAEEAKAYGIIDGVITKKKIKIEINCKNT